MLGIWLIRIMYEESIDSDLEIEWTGISYTITIGLVPTTYKHIYLNSTESFLNCKIYL